MEMYLGIMSRNIEAHIEMILRLDNAYPSELILLI